MSQGRISRASRRYPDARRRAALYAQTRYGQRSTTLPPHLLPGVSGRQATGNAMRTRLLAAGVVLALGFALFLTVSIVSGTVAAVNGTMIAYEEVNKDLPDAGGIFAETFQTTKIYDRDGKTLQEIADPNQGWRTFVPYGEISPYLVDATVAAEDATFWNHYGVEPYAILRGGFIIFTGSGSSGGSTISQQLVRSLYPEQIGFDYSVLRKGREALAAVELERRYSKVDIITMYLNQIYYGQRSYGIEAAANTFFDKRAADLTLAEASLLAGLPQLPSLYDPTVNFELSKQRQEYVLDQMVKLGYVGRAEADAAYAETLTIRGDRNSRVLDNPHFTQYVSEFIRQNYGEDALLRGGLQVTTTIDSDLQDEAETIVREQVAAVADYNISNGAAVVMVPHTGEILAMVGSANYDDPLIDGAVNVTTSLRQPGSSLKPFVYLTAFEQAHWHPGTTVLDVPFERETPQGTYEPQNFTSQFYGAVTVRTAVANSLNIPALKALETIGGQEFMDSMDRLGLKDSWDTYSAADCGLAIALGACEIQMVEMANAYGTLANNGKYVPITPISKITDGQGNVLFELDRSKSLAEAEQVVRAEYAYQVTDMVTDNEARHMLFGEGNLYEQTQQELGRPLGVKTGTTNDVRDSWTTGYTTSAVVTVWTGNSDNQEMDAAPADGGATGIWSDLLLLIHQDERFRDLIAGPDGQPMPEEFPRPEGIYEGAVCANTAHRATDGASTRTALLARGNEPILRCDQLSAWEQRDVEQALEVVGDPRMVGGAADSVRRYAAEATGGNPGGGSRIEPSEGSEAVESEGDGGGNPGGGNDGGGNDGGDQSQAPPPEEPPDQGDEQPQTGAVRGPRDDEPPIQPTD